MRLLITGIWTLMFTVFSLADTYVRQPSVDVFHYDISIELTDTSDSITGTTKVHVLMRNDGVSGMWLDFEGMSMDKLLVQGIERHFDYHGGRLSFDFDRKYSKNEIVVVEVRYHGKPEHGGMMIGKNGYGRRVIFTDNWPENARRWFPSIDHPSDKATVDVTVTAPEKYDAVSNGRLVKTLSMLDGRKITQWTESKPIPTYCISIGVAEFSITRQKDAGGIELDWYSYPQDSDAAARKFSTSASALQYFESSIGPYPYEKLAQVQSNIQGGGMENASAIFYRESYFKDMLVSEYPVVHEIAHQWFGDSVTEADWDHLWLSEGFATYFEALFYEHLRGPESLRQTMAGYAKRLNGLESARSVPIIDPSQTDLMQKLNPLTYEKGAWVLHMLRGILGDADFFEGIRRYYKIHAEGNALSEDFQKAMESVSGIPLSIFFRQWLYRPGWPEYRVSWHWDENAGEVELAIHQIQNSGLFDMPLDIAFLEENRQEVHKFRVTDAEHRFRVPMRTRPLSIEIDPGGWVLKSISDTSYY